MLARLLVVGVFILVGVVVYFLVRASMNRGTKPSRGRPAAGSAPVDIVDLPSSPTSGTPKYETPDERIARLEEELRRLDDEGMDSPKKDS
jgi:hypothetical protein